MNGFGTTRTRRVTREFALLACLIAHSTGCGKVGEPLPPLAQPPATVQDLRTARAGSSMDLFFSIPSSDVRWVEVFRQCDPRMPTDRISLVARIAWEELRETNQANMFTWRDRNPPQGPSCRYAVRFINGRGMQSDYSNFAPAPAGPTPED